MGLTQTRNNRSQANLQALHGGLFLALLPISSVIPDLAGWPWLLLVPLAFYGIIVCLIPPLRRSVHWIKFGNLGGKVLLATAAIIVVTSLALLWYNAQFKQDVLPLSQMLPFWLPVPVVVAGALFSILNALMEEVIFRGILLDALASQVGSKLAVVVQALAFAVGHSQGYPPGNFGMVLAGTYGLVLGLLRLWTGGLAAPWIAHVFADATIFWIVVSGGSNPPLS